jgi:Cu+-exporting ATPase
MGVSGVVDGHAVAAGRAGWLSSSWGWPVPDGLAARVAAAEAAGRTVVVAGWDGAVRGVLVVADTIKPTSAEAIRRLQQAGRVVAMAGDGVNDAAALAQADLGLAMGTGTDAAIEASDLTLVRGDLLAVPDAILLSRRTLATIRGNLFWAFGYNTAAIPLAALGFLNPLIAATAMAFSSVFVVGNSLRLRRWRPRAGR